MKNPSKTDTFFVKLSDKDNIMISTLGIYHHTGISMIVDWDDVFQTKALHGKSAIFLINVLKWTKSEEYRFIKAHISRHWVK